MAEATPEAVGRLLAIGNALLAKFRQLQEEMHRVDNPRFHKPHIRDEVCGRGVIRFL